MKKVISIVLVLMILLSLSACGGKAADSSKAGYPGTWKIDHLVIEGAEYAQSELAALGDYRGQALLVIKDGGKAYEAENGKLSGSKDPYKLIANAAYNDMITKQKMAFFWMAKKF